MENRPYVTMVTTPLCHVVLAKDPGDFSRVSNNRTLIRSVRRVDCFGLKGSCQDNNNSVHRTRSSYNNMYSVHDSKW